MQNKFKAVKIIFIVILVSVVLVGVLGLTVHLIRKNSGIRPEPIPSSCSIEIPNFEFGRSGSGSYSLCSSRETDELIKHSFAEYGYFDLNITLDIDTAETLQWEFEFTNGADLSDKIEVLVNESDSRKAVVRLKDMSLFPTNDFTICLHVYNSDRTQYSSFVFDLFTMPNVYFYDSDVIVELSNFEFGICNDDDSPYLINSKETYAKIVNSIENKGYYDIFVQLDCDIDEELSWQVFYLDSSKDAEDYLEVYVDIDDSRKAAIRIKNLEVSYLPIVSVSNSDDESYIYVSVLDFGDVLILF